MRIEVECFADPEEAEGLRIFFTKKPSFYFASDFMFDGGVIADCPIKHHGEEVLFWGVEQVISK